MSSFDQLRLNLRHIIFLVLVSQIDEQGCQTCFYVFLKGSKTTIIIETQKVADAIYSSSAWRIHFPALVQRASSQHIYRTACPNQAPFSRSRHSNLEYTLRLRRPRRQAERIVVAPTADPLTKHAGAARTSAPKMQPAGAPPRLRLVRGKPPRHQQLATYVAQDQIEDRESLRGAARNDERGVSALIYPGCIQHGVLCPQTPDRCH